MLIKEIGPLSLDWKFEVTQLFTTLLKLRDN